MQSGRNTVLTGFSSDLRFASQSPPANFKAAKRRSVFRLIKHVLTRPGAFLLNFISHNHKICASPNQQKHQLRIDLVSSYKRTILDLKPCDKSAILVVWHKRISYQCYCGSQRGQASLSGCQEYGHFFVFCISLICWNAGCSISMMFVDFSYSVL